MATDKSLRETRLVFYKEDIDSINAVMDAFLKQSAAKPAALVAETPKALPAAKKAARPKPALPARG